MADELFVKGLGTLGLAIGDTPDLRLLLMTDWTCDIDAINLSEATYTVFAGVGYSNYDASGVVVAYDNASHEMYIDFDDGDSIWGTTVAADPDDIVRCVAVVGNPATPTTCKLVGSTDEITGNANGLKLGATFPARWIHFVQG